MKKDYQYNYSLRRKNPNYEKSRLQKAQRALKLFSYHFKDKKLSTLRLLDVGCSTGIIDNEFSKKFKEVIGVDIDKNAIDKANSSYNKKNLKFAFGDAMKLKFKNAVFDVVVCMHIYEHVPDEIKLFKEIYRVLRPGGIVYLTAGNRLWPWEPHYNLPFLTYLPKILANRYLKICGKGDSYYETLRTYWGLKKLTKIFFCHDYTLSILRFPKTFGFEDILPEKSLKSIIAKLIPPFAKYLVPTFFWILEKDSNSFTQKHE